MEIQVSKAKRHWPKIAARVLEGETIVLTRWGEPIAQLAPLVFVPPPVFIEATVTTRKARAELYGIVARVQATGLWFIIRHRWRDRFVVKPCEV